MSPIGCQGCTVSVRLQHLFMHFNKCDGRRRSSKLMLKYQDQEGIGHGCNGEEEACQRFVCSAARVWLATEEEEEEAHPY